MECYSVELLVEHNLFPLVRLQQFRRKQNKTIVMKGPHHSGLEVDPRYVNGQLIRHVHLMSPHHEPEASGLQVAGFAQSEIVLPNDTVHRIYEHRKSEIKLPKDTAHRICGYRKTTVWLSLALVAFVAMGVTGISIAGFLATKWKSETKEK